MSPSAANRAELFEELLRRKGLAVEPAPSLPARGEGPWPLSFAQERLWLLDRLHPGDPAYHVPLALAARGSLDPRALAAAFSRIAARHETLRTTFVPGVDGPVQRIAPPAPVPLPTVDLDPLSPETARAEAERRAGEEARRPFDLERGPLVRLLLFRLSGDEHVLLLTFHHIVADGWSMSLLIRELVAFYQEGEGARLPALPIQYADFAVEQRRRLAGPELERQLAHWRDRLAGVPPLLDLPTDRPRPAVASGRGGERPVALGSLPARRGLTPFMVLLGAFQTLLHRLTGSPLVPVGSPVAGRTRVETEPLIGFFANTLVFVAEASADLPFDGFLDRVRQSALAAYAHQELPFEKLVEELRPERSLAHAPVFQVMLVLQNTPAAALRLPGLTLTPVPLELGAAKFDLTLLLREGETGLTGTLEYNRDLWDGVTVDRWLGHLRTLLAAAAREPGTRLAELPLLTGPEAHQLLEWNDTSGGSWAGVESLPGLFEAAARRHPQAPAVIHDGTLLTYAGLAERAGRLAAFLLRRGLGPDARVALSVERSPEMAVAVLGILQAGAAYVPLDPAYPRERLDFMLADSGAALLLVGRGLADRFPGAPCPVIAIDEATAPATPRPAIDPDTLAYVLYTSGSTGRPKGVAMPHRPLVNLLAWQARRSPRAGRTLQLAPLSFDVSCQEMFATWATGGALVLVSEETRRDPFALLPFLAGQQVERLFLPFVALDQLATAAASSPLPAALREVITAGEPLRVTPAVAALFRGLGGATLENQYGPTETHVVSAHRLGGPPEAWPALPPVGRPVDRTALHVLDSGGGSAPVGVPGELAAGGTPLARGYLGRPGLTAERFVPDPFGAPGARLYRTGDLARRLPGGELEILGRLDGQVKVRGIRIEPGEVEAALARHPAVRAVAVAASGEGSGERFLAAWVVPAEEARDAASLAAELRSFLAGRLPEALIPAVFQTLDRLPLTPSGKVDRRALPAPGVPVPAEPGASPDLRTPTEELLAGIWREVLGVEPAPGSSFFELGGHSLLATRVLSRVRRIFGTELPLRALFEAPTLAGFARRVEAARREGGGTAPPIVPVPRQGRLPLSFAQQRLWFLDRLTPGSAVYNLPAALRLTGPLDPAALDNALAAVIRRHEALRTRCGETAGEPFQIIDPPGPFPLAVADLSALPDARRESEARRLAREEAARPFDLARGPLLRAGLLHLAVDQHVLLLTLHHLIADGWSLSLLVREMAALYRSAPLPPLPLQPADVAVWQRAWLQGEELERQLGYWRERLAGAPPSLDLPTDRQRPPMPSSRGSCRTALLPASLAARLEELGRREGATLFMILLAGFSALLSRLSGASDLTVGSPVANRHRMETEGLIGLFANTLALRIDLGGDPGLRELTERVRRTVLEADAHQDLPFERLVEELLVDRALDRSPLFQVMLAFEAEAVPPELPGLALRPLPAGGTVARFDLTLAVRPGPGGIALAAEHSTDLFDGVTLGRWLRSLERLLGAAVAEPERPFSSLPLLGAAELHQLTVEWNDTAREHPADACLHELVAAQAAKTPDAVAAVFEEQSLTYRELDRQAGRLAARLIRRGVAPEDRVGVLLERSLEMIVGLLGVLKAGAAYVPLDPTWPAERLAVLVESAGISVVLAQEHLTGLLPAGPAVLLPPFADGESPGAAGGASGDHAAYVLFTSGSTGTPKGVVIPHRGIVNRLLWMQEAYGLAAGDRVLQKTPFSFDVSVWEFFWPLLAGARLVFARPEGHKDPVYLAGLIAREGITTLHFVPALLQAFLAAPGVEELTGLRRVMASGEALPLDLVRRFSARLPGVELHNLYGPTEASVDVSFWPCDPEPPRAVVPIGRPIANLRLHVVDRALRPQPVGVPGELLLGGVGLARGYLGRPDLTAAAFVPDPFGGAGGRLYRTGDLCRTLPDGNVEYLGRIDHQVKIRGVRIELGEIEAVLAGHPQVRECAAGVVGGAGAAADDRRLAAWVVPRPETRLDLRDLAGYLRERLPDPMVPSAFVLLAALPLTTSGKVDRKALPAPAGPRRESGGGAAPSDPVEELLAGIWAEVLRLDHVGVDESFFALGGHSLLATQVVSRVRAVLGVELPLRQLFAAPTVAGLARLVRQAREETREEAGQDDGRRAPAIVPVPREGALPLSFGQQRLWFLDQLSPGSPAYNIPLALRLSGPLHAGALEAALGEVARRHEALRTSFPTVAGQPVQAIAAPSPLPLARIDLSGLERPRRQGEVRRVVRDEALRLFDLATGPLIRSALVRLAPEEHAVLVTLHHIVSDGWSTGVLVREITALYSAFAQERPSPLPELVVQFADYAAWQRAWLSGERLEAEIAWWKGRLAGVPAALELPVDRPRPARQTFRGAAWPLALPPESRHALVSLGRAAGATPFMVLLALFQGVIARWSGQEDFVIGTPIAGRVRAETEPLIGFFVNTLPLRTGLAGDPALQTLLERVRETALDAYAHQEIPFERLVEEVQPERDLGRTALVQVLLALQNTPPAALQAHELSFEPLEPENETAKLDLSLHLTEQEDWLRGAFTYSTDLFEAATIGRLAGHFVLLLDAAAADPGRRLSDLPLLGPAERHQLLAESAPGSAPAGERCIHDLFAEQAARTPDAPAVRGEEGVLTYAELGRRARNLARRLRAAGAGPDQPVLLRAERGVDLVVGLLGILESGGAYLAVEPDLPRARLELLAEDSGARLAVTQHPLADGLPEALRRIYLDDPEDGGGSPAEGPEAAVAPGHLAYVLYTSGSTGRPKGVLVEHRQLAAYVRGLVERLALPPGASFATVSSFAADLGHTSIFAALLGGGCLHVVPRERLADASALAEWMERHPVDGLKIVPSHLAALLTADRPERLLPRRWLVLGGEALSWNLVERVRALAPECRLLHHYGPTETAVGVVAGDPGEHRAGAGVPLGRPLGLTRAWVAGPHRQLVPFGTPGELWIGGPQVTRGYLGRPDLTAERFIPDPFGTEAGGRLYRTGDLVRRRADGALEFLGRIDDQVKIRGFRIELAEVEAALLGLPEVREAAALVRRREDGDRSLAAFVAVETPVAAGELLARLRDQLPAPLVPSDLGFVDTLPRTANGKVDRQALAALPLSGRPVDRADAGDAADPLTGMILALWTELGLPRARPHDDFFAIGGHSLLATRVLSRLREACGVELPLRTLFEARTPERLAAAVREARRGGAGHPAPPLVPVPREGDLPLSFAQQRLWFLAQLAPDSPAYNIPLAVLLHGHLDVPRLVEALRAVERRHEVLRTTFALAEGEPVQRPGAAPRLEVPVADLLSLPQAARREEIERLARAEALRPFDLAAGPIWRARLVRLAEQEHAALLTLHHIASDGWSRGLLLRELGELYGAPDLAAAPALPPLPVQYADFAVWQRGWLQGEALREQLDFWRRQLAGAPRLLELPTDRPRPARQTFRGISRPVVLASGLSQRLAALCREAGATPFMALLAAWALLLGRHAHQEDVLAGSPIAGRGRREIEDLIGCFLNTLVLRIDLAGSPGFRPLLGRVRSMALDAYAHQDLPFERLVEELVSERDLAVTPLVQNLFVLQNAPAGTLRASGLVLEPLEIESGVAKFDLALAMTETPSGFAGSLEVNADLFDPGTAERLAARFAALLEAAVADSGRPAADLPLLLPGEQAQLLAWNSTGEPPSTDLCLHELFAIQAARTPGAFALVDGTARWTYTELAARTGGMARRLRSLGVGPETRAAVCMERSADLVAALLAVLAAGGAYVPIDPAYPRERRALLLEDSGARVLVTRGALAADLPLTGARRLDLDAEEISPSPLPEDSGATPDHLAYVIYTSGSTGLPKGVAIEHRSAAALAGWARQRFSAEELAGVLASTSVCFDLSVFEIFIPLACGGTVFLAENALALPALPARSEVRLLNTVPSAAAELVRSNGLPTGVRTVCLAGEPLPAPLAAQLHATGTVRRVFNLYGPSEDTTYSTGALVPGSPEAALRPPAIGRPLPGTRAWVVDRHGTLVPPGVAGELWLAGAGLARGYLGRPELTAERFLPDPFTAEPGARLYRTGDLARWRSEGELEFLGRLDHQVKVRGFRIELGEIEAVLASHPEVREAVVLVREDGPGGSRLVAYAVLDGPETDLREFLGGRLPAYMVPETFVFLEALPRTPNGKVDRRALPAPERVRPAGAAPAAPSDPVEERLASLWSQVLGTGQVGVQDDFFALGGHSLLAVRLMSGIAAAFGHDLPPAVLFRERTVEKLARLLRGAPAPSPGRSLVALTAPSSAPPLFLVHAVGGGILGYAPLARRLAPLLPVSAFQSPGLDGGPVPGTVEEMAAAYVAELRAARPEGPYLLGGWSAGGLIACEMARQLTGSGLPVEALLLLDSPLPGWLPEPGSDAESEARFGLDLLRRAGSATEAAPLSWDRFCALGPDERFQELLRLADGEEAVLRRLLHVFVSHDRALARYRPALPAPPPHRVLLALPERSERPPDARLHAWSETLSCAVTALQVPGDHHSMIEEPAAEVLARRIGEFLGLRPQPVNPSIE